MYGLDILFIFLLKRRAKVGRSVKSSKSTTGRGFNFKSLLRVLLRRRRTVLLLNEKRRCCCACIILWEGRFLKSLLWGSQGVSSAAKILAVVSSRASLCCVSGSSSMAYIGVFVLCRMGVLLASQAVGRLGGKVGRTGEE